MRTLLLVGLLCLALTLPVAAAGPVLPEPSSARGAGDVDEVVQPALGASGRVCVRTDPPFVVFCNR